MYSATQLAHKYLRYYLSASNGKGHGIHSPFVFEFIKFVLNDKKPYPCYIEIERLRERLLKDRSVIEVEDFGAGSSVIKSSKRVLKDMAASSLKPKKYAQLLYRMAQKYQPVNMVELGTSFGITTAYLATGNPAAKIYTLEGSASIASIAKNNFTSLGIKNIELVPGDFNDTLPAVLTGLKTVDFAFVDGNHRKAPTLQYLQQLAAMANENAIFVFDDIHWSAEMEEAWQKIKAHPAITLTIDLFFIGIVLFKKDFKAKQHFVIRF
ncbi:MAG: class I SAM-dependent methyltransferase [Ferruginibacter sp.]